MSEALAIVDPFSSGLAYAAAARNLGLEPIILHTYTPPADAALRKFQSEPAAQDLRLEVDHLGLLTARNHHALGNAGRVVGERLWKECAVRGWRLKGIVAGSELGVPIADSAASHLGLIGNATGQSVACRHKGRMKDVSRAHGLPCADYAEIGSIQDLEVFQRSHPRYPIFLKPPMGGGSTAVRKCRDEKEARANLAELLEIPDFFGFRAGYVLAETFLEGMEYAVNLFCMGPRTMPLITDIWEYKRVDTDAKAYFGTNVYHTETTIGPDCALWPVLEGAAQSFASAFGRYFGPVHLEVKLDCDRVSLIEIGGRLAGGGIPEMIRHATGRDVVKASAALFAGKECSEFLREQSGQQAVIVSCNALATGIVEEVMGLGEIGSLPTLFNPSDVAKAERLVGQEISATVDTSTCPLLVKLVGKREAVIRDAEKVHSLFSLRLKEGKTGARR